MISFTQKILDKLGLDDRPAKDLEGLQRLYQAWCYHVPFDNVKNRGTDMAQRIIITALPALALFLAACGKQAADQGSAIAMHNVRLRRRWRHRLRQPSWARRVKGMQVASLAAHRGIMFDAARQDCAATFFNTDWYTR